MHKIRVSICFYGRVQGVGFRYFAQMNAAQFHVTGWVKNMYDGSVTAEAQGTKKQIEDFIESMKHGHRFMRIDHVTAEECPLCEGEKDFKVKY